MLKQWQQYLESRNGVWNAGRLTNFGDVQSEFKSAITANIIADLSHCGLAAAHGADAQAFLQGQFSNDVDVISAKNSQLNSYCTPKGRMLAIFLLFQRNDVFYLRMPREILAGFLKRLGMFVMRAKLTLEDAGDQLVRFGISGPTADDALKTLWGGIPATPYDVMEHDAITLVRIPGPQPRFELYGPLEAMQTAWDGLGETCTPVGAGPWELLDILAGIPTVYSATVDAFVPQMANMDIIDGVNFKKGCYPGQEIVARTKYLGKLKRRMYLGRIQSPHLPEPGAELFPATGDTSQAAGRIVSAQPHPDGGYAVLAVLKIAETETGGVRLDDAKGPALELENLPYSL